MNVKLKFDTRGFIMFEFGKIVKKGMAQELILLQHFAMRLLDMFLHGICFMILFMSQDRVRAVLIKKLDT